MVKKRPWLKVTNKDGTCIVRCKDPYKAAWYFIEHLWDSGDFAQDEYWIGRKLTIDGIEYNTPNRKNYIGTGNGDAFLQEISEELEYLIDLHQAFYYD